MFWFSSPLAYRDPLHCNMNRLFVMLFKDSLTEYAYDAELAGLKYSVNVNIYGINVSCPQNLNFITFPYLRIALMAA